MALCRFAQSSGPTINLKIGDDVPDVAALARVVCWRDYIENVFNAASLQVKREFLKKVLTSPRQALHPAPTSVYRVLNFRMPPRSTSTMGNQKVICCLTLQRPFLPSQSNEGSGSSYRTQPRTWHSLSQHPKPQRQRQPQCKKTWILQ